MTRRSLFYANGARYFGGAVAVRGVAQFRFENTTFGQNMSTADPVLGEFFGRGHHIGLDPRIPAETPLPGELHGQIIHSTITDAGTAGWAVFNGSIESTVDETWAQVLIFATLIADIGASCANMSQIVVNNEHNVYQDGGCGNPAPSESFFVPYDTVIRPHDPWGITPDLNYYGGFTRTYAIYHGSPVHNRYFNPEILQDQRALNRDNYPDAGAFEHDAK